MNGHVCTSASFGTLVVGASPAVGLAIKLAERALNQVARRADRGEMHARCTRDVCAMHAR
eukprot:5452693-Pleurochrysis_carterae.AAC.2